MTRANGAMVAREAKMPGEDSVYSDGVILVYTTNIQCLHGLAPRGPGGGGVEDVTLAGGAGGIKACDRLSTPKGITSHKRGDRVLWGTSISRRR